MAEHDPHQADASIVKAKINSIQSQSGGNIDLSGISPKEKSEYLAKKRAELSMENKTKIDSIKSTIIREVEKDADGKISREEMRGIFNRVQESRDQELKDLQIDNFETFLEFIGLNDFYNNWQEQNFNQNEEKMLSGKLGLKQDDFHELMISFSRCGINIKPDLIKISEILDQLKPTNELTADEVEWIKYNIKTSLYLLLTSYSKDLKSKDENYKWHFNDKTSNSFSKFYNTVIRTSLFVVDYSKNGHEEGTKASSVKEREVETNTYNRLKNLLTKKINFNDKGEFSELVYSGHDGEMAYGGKGSHHSFEVPSLKKVSDKTQKMSAEANYLNETDSKIDEQVKAKYLIALIIQCVPTVGTAVSIPVDIADLVSNQDGTINLLKSVGSVPKDYVIQPNFFAQKGFALLDIILTIIAAVSLDTIPVDSVANIGKMLKSSPKFIGAALRGLKQIKVEEVIAEIAAKLGKKVSMKNLTGLLNKIPDVAQSVGEYKSRV